MKRRPAAPELDALKRRVSATDAAVIDELYGLEPVYEPEASGRASRFATEFVAILCPYCWERYETEVDLSAGSCSYVEDCRVCCQPIQLTCDVDGEGTLLGVKPERMD
jgi:Cysteine-rich CPXCG